LPVLGGSGGRRPGRRNPADEEGWAWRDETAGGGAVEAAANGHADYYQDADTVIMMAVGAFPADAGQPGWTTELAAEASTGPLAAVPAADDPGAEHPGAWEPGAWEPGAWEPSAEQPVAGEPEAAGPEPAEPVPAGEAAVADDGLADSPGPVDSEDPGPSTLIIPALRAGFELDGAGQAQVAGDGDQGSGGPQDTT
jgi:hypothetical protein